MSIVSFFAGVGGFYFSFSRGCHYLISSVRKEKFVSADAAVAQLTGVHTEVA